MTRQTKTATFAVMVALAGAASVGLLAQRASPHETAQATIEGQTISITYGRPYMKGRKIMGGLVPYGRVWRTGADEATTLKTAATLVIGGVTVPAGEYTLYTLPDAASWKLIINKQTGQWGTEYLQDQDLGRVDMKMATLAQPIEQLTITIEPAHGGGVLRLQWDTTDLTVPLAVKKND